MSVLENFNESFECNRNPSAATLKNCFSKASLAADASFLSKFLKNVRIQRLDKRERRELFLQRSFERISLKEVIQPHLPVRLPCYDFTPVMKPTVDAVLLAVGQTSSGEPHSHGVTGGVYKTRERIHRGMLIRDY